MAGTSEDGIIIRSMTVADHQEVIRLLDESFSTGEPLCVYTGFKIPHKEGQNDHNYQLIEQGHSLVAEQDNQIVGFILAGVQVADDVKQFRERASGRISMFLAMMETEANLHERYNVSQLLDLHIITVIESMRGRGLGVRLTKALMEAGHAKGFPLIAACCTSYYAAKLMQSVGMECVYSMAYADYKNEEGEVVFKPPAPYTHARVMVRRL